jgi:hypothetical protein
MNEENEGYEKEFNKDTWVGTWLKWCEYLSSKHKVLNSIPSTT